MIKVGIHVLGQKGFECLRAVHQYAFENKEAVQILFVEYASDKNIDNDFSKEISHFCADQGLNVYKRGDAVPSKSQADISFAIGWRWLIHENSDHLIVLHDSILPKYRGFNPLVTALIEGDNEIGVTALKADAQFDRGSIVGMKKIKIQYPMKIAQAIEIISGLYSKLIVEVLHSRSQGTLKETVQDDSQATYSLWRDDEDYLIDWSQPAPRIERMIHAVGTPYKGAESHHDGKKICITDAQALKDMTIVNRVAGKILFMEDKCPVVVCGSGLLKILSAHDAETNEPVVFSKLRARFK